MEASSETSHAFDDEAWTAYKTAVDEMMTSTRVLKNDKPENLEEAKAALLSKNLLPLNTTTTTTTSQLSGTTTTTTIAQQTRDQWTTQAADYKEHYNLTKQQFNFCMRVLVYLGDYCAKRRITAPIQVAWEKLKESGIIPAENAFSTYMYILGTDNACRDSLLEVAKMHDALFAPNEKTVTLRIKTLIAKNEIAQAEEILSSLKNISDDGDVQKLRTFLPILDHYCANGDCKSILRIYRDMRESSRVHFDVDTYTLILCTLAEEGCFSANASPIEDAAKAGFNATCGPMLFDQLVAELAEDLLELTEDSCRSLSTSLSKSICPKDLVDEDQLPLLQNATQPNSSPLVVGRTKIDLETALCPATGAKLRLINLDEEQRQHVHDTLIEMAELQFLEFTKNRKHPVDENGNKGLEELTKFSEWLDNREGEPFTVVVDGPNIGFFGYGSFHYSQVKAIVDELERMGEKPLVTMPNKYIGPSFFLRKGQHQRLADKDLLYIEKLKEEQKLYVVPQLCLDDYYWMLASVSNQTCSRQGQDLRVPVSSNEGRFPGVRPILVTNDQMRDHKLDLLEPREFRRWCSCHIVNYNLLKTNADEWEDRQVKLFPADFFSREIQCNPWGENADRHAWHFPVTEWDGSDRFLVSIAR
ncbi:unnamed protein product [Cylindrotheca closterium]|uniref:PROP1-like PPR domain-containing protein n=1 Tax=Cylindrotheca closterium TaxID=2856 RepID=A0AAD2FI69_9STRA|nr:unnamed protein product [Cylindrotheca closterium]